ncbi:hypothetical protein ACF06X_34515 [Streptomyces sp. NPDC015346]|uniref:hypothetical protein n=1 Tax=Streptomyces sp. NPDC015346 TaxID=3364954 RepID=UPI0036F76A65
MEWMPRTMSSTAPSLRTTAPGARHRVHSVGSTRWTMSGIVTTARRWSAALGTGRGHHGARRRCRSGSAGSGAGEPVAVLGVDAVEDRLQTQPVFPGRVEAELGAGALAGGAEVFGDGAEVFGGEGEVADPGALERHGVQKPERRGAQVVGVR